MSEPRKNNLDIDGGQVKEDEHNIGTYKPVPESDRDQGQQFIVVEAEYGQIEQSDIMDTDTDDCDLHWDHESTELLLNTYLANLDKFRDPRIKKKNIWIDISKAVGKGPYGCDKKFRNLKQTFVRLLKKKNKEGLATIKWPYFNIFEEIYSNNGEYSSDLKSKLEEDVTKDSIAKVLLINSSKYDLENGESSKGNNSEGMKRINRKRHADFKKVTSELSDRQKVVEDKLDKLISIVEESNKIQQERNKLFVKFLEKLNKR